MFERYYEIQERRKENSESGFTLIELLIVIIVLGILAVVVVFALGSVTGQSAVAACNSDAKTVSTAVSADLAQAQTPPAALTIANLVSGGYLKSSPNSTYYSVQIGGTTPNFVVQIALASTDPGAQSSSNPNSATVTAVPAGSEPTTPGSTFWDYEGAANITATTGPYQWASGNKVSAPAGANICSGA